MSFFVICNVIWEAFGLCFGIIPMGKIKKTTADPRYTAAPSEVIDGTVRNEPCIQKGGVKGVYGVEAGARDPMGLR